MARLICTIAIIGITLMCVLAEEDKYDDKYDGIDIEGILLNNELRNQLFNCLMRTGPCVTDYEKYFSTVFSEAVQTQCSKCTEKQKFMLEIYLNWYKKNQPENWKQIMEKTEEIMKKRTR